MNDGRIFGILHNNISLRVFKLTIRKNEKYIDFYNNSRNKFKDILLPLPRQQLK